MTGAMSVSVSRMRSEVMHRTIQRLCTCAILGTAVLAGAAREAFAAGPQAGAGAPEHWAFQPIRAVPLPPDSDRWSDNPVLLADLNSDHCATCRMYSSAARFHEKFVWMWLMPAASMRKYSAG